MKYTTDSAVPHNCEWEYKSFTIYFNISDLSSTCPFSACLAPFDGDPDIAGPGVNTVHLQS
jgi:hypothetical protein